jgi:oligoribonuclease (3'-5' exoribonuclease)
MLLLYLPYVCSHIHFSSLSIMPFEGFCQAITPDIRSIIQKGLLYHLCSPIKGSVAALQFVARDGYEIVVLLWGHGGMCC